MRITEKENLFVKKWMLEKLECRRLKVERPNVERLNVDEGEHRKILA